MRDRFVGVMVILFVALVFAFMVSKNSTGAMLSSGKYQIVDTSKGPMLVDTEQGDTWTLTSRGPVNGWQKVVFFNDKK